MADFRREYGITAVQLGDLGRSEFVTLLRGLSPESMWRYHVKNTPQVVDGEAAAALLDRL